MRGCDTWRDMVQCFGGGCVGRGTVCSGLERQAVSMTRGGVVESPMARIREWFCYLVLKETIQVEECGCYKLATEQPPPNI